MLAVQVLRWQCSNAGSRLRSSPHSAAAAQADAGAALPANKADASDSSTPEFSSKTQADQVVVQAEALQSLEVSCADTDTHSPSLVTVTDDSAAKGNYVPNRRSTTSSCTTTCSTAQDLDASASESTYSDDNSSQVDAGGAAKPRLVLSLQQAEHEPAAMAVLAALYGVKPLPELLADLPQEQQLQAAVLADMWEIPTVSSAAVRMLLAAAQQDSSSSSSGGSSGLGVPVVQHFLALEAYPSCLLPLLSCMITAAMGPSAEAEQQEARIKRTMLSVLGNLEEVWRDAVLKYTLLALPLPIMALLLSFDELKVGSSRCRSTETMLVCVALQRMTYAHTAIEQSLLSQESTTACIASLKLCHPCWCSVTACHPLLVSFLVLSLLLQVASEDTVLYTGQTYVDEMQDPQQKLAAQAQLARLIRAQHLSLYWLTTSALSAGAPALLLSGFVEQLKKLLMLRAGDPEYHVQADDLQELLPGAPDSWVAAKRASTQVSSVTLVWELDVGTLREEALRSVMQGTPTILSSPILSSPMGGIVWSMLLHCEYRADEGGSLITVFAEATNACVDTYLRFSFALSVEGSSLSCSGASKTLTDRKGWGWPDFFEVGTMSGGWDDAAWAANGLPAAGPLTLKLRITGVGHSA